MRGLEKDPAQRFPDARALAAALSACRDADGWTMAAARAWWQERALPKPLAGVSTTTKYVAPSLHVGKPPLDS